MSDTQAPKILTLEVLDELKNSLLTTVHLLPESSTNINSIIQSGANEDKNTGEQNILRVKNSVIFGTNHTANALSNIFMSGRGNIATANNQTILGNFNAVNNNALFMFGKGTNNNNRANAVTILKNGDVNVNNLAIKETTDSVIIESVDNKKICFNTNLLFNTAETNITEDNFMSEVLQLDDKKLITADIAKQIIKALAFYLEDGQNGTTKTLSQIVSELTTWQKSLVQNVDYEGSDANKKALSVTAGQQLAESIKNKNDANVTDLRNEINELRKQISYLISSLTVDKISNNDTEFYAVGVADFAFDADTRFKFVPVSEETNNE